MNKKIVGAALGLAVLAASSDVIATRCRARPSDDCKCAD
jgi:hypothetical protein